VNSETEPKEPTKPAEKSRVRWYRRPASVLLIVIVLLLLLAILGTAYLSTSRADRLTSAQNVLSAQSDIQLDGISRMISGIIVNDLNDAPAIPTPTFGGYMHGNFSAVVNPSSPPYHLTFQGQWNAATTYQAGDVVYPAGLGTNFYVCAAGPSRNVAPPSAAWELINTWNPVDAGPQPIWMNTAATPPGYGMPIGPTLATSSLSQPWIASRIPSFDPAGTGWPYWANISCSIPEPIAVPSARSVIGTLQFEDPTTGNTTSASAAASHFYPGFGQYSANMQIYPTLTLGGAPTANLVTLAAGAVNTPAATMVAADADGDGIADSLLFRIPGANFDGLTWYAAVRIVDNNSAINVNTAWSRDQDYTVAGAGYGTVQTNWGFFPSNIGLLELLNLNDQTVGPSQINAAFNLYRCNGPGDPVQTPYDQTNFPPPDSSFPTAGAFPISPARNDFQYLSFGDAFNSQFARRLDNPGLNLNGATWTRYRAIPQGDQADLAYHFCLVNPNSGQTLLESKLLPASLYTGYSSSPFSVVYSAGGGDWWNSNFNYPVAPAATPQNNNNKPIRPLLVARNPVSNYIEPVYDPTHFGEPLYTIPDTIFALPTAPSTPTVTTPGAVGEVVASQMMLPYGNGHFKGTWTAAPAAPYIFGDIVQYGKYTFIEVAPGGAGGTAPEGTIDQLSTTNTSVWQFQPWTQYPVKANVNTATFRELLRAYASVMAGNPATQTVYGTDPATYGTPYPAPGAGPNFVPFHQFRSPLRDPTYLAGNATTWLPPSQVMMLRAALAAVNTLGLRDDTQNVISRTIWLYAYVAHNVGGTITSVPHLVETRVYSSAPQPFISEVYVNTDIKPSPNDANDATLAPNPHGYIAIELFNPTSAPLILNNWQLALVQRPNIGATTYPNLQFTTPSIGLLNINSSVANATAIPAHGYAILENYNAYGTGDAQYRPQNSGLPNGALPGTPTNPLPGPIVNTVDVYIPNLYQVITNATGTGGELVILRPRRADGLYTKNDNTVANYDPLDIYDEGSTAVPNLYDMVPVDSYDFTNISQELVEPFHAYSYIRLKKAVGPFTVTYPDRYTTLGLLGPNTGTLRQTGTTWQPITAAAPNPAFAPPPVFQNNNLPGSASVSNPFPPIQVSNVGTDASGTLVRHWPNPVAQMSLATQQPVATAAPVSFPFGAFPRNGDMLDVPFIGAYRMRVVDLPTPATNPPTYIFSDPYTTPPLTFTDGSHFLELNSLPVDCSFADDGDTTAGQQTIEQIGRFCPLYARPTPPPINYPDYYAWARNLFDYLTVQSNSDNYMPNYDAGVNDPTLPANPIVNKYPLGSGGAPPTIPTQVQNADATAGNSTMQDNVGVDGLININTASWKVLSMLPMIPGNPLSNENLAKAIVTYRDGPPGGAGGHGPFMSIFDLNEVLDVGTAGFQNAEGSLTLTAVTSTDRILTPPDPNFPNISGTPNNMGEDYQSDFAVLDRISNLITTRSDTFTVYIVVEGWQNAVLPGQVPYNPAAATPMPVPTLKVLRRFSFIADRSAISADPTTRYLKTIAVPND
jgi:hypothetical protein